ncbi:MAG: glucosaminidase domain-containing protein [Candidatus Sulfotelmatobacter sp.]
MGNPDPDVDKLCNVQYAVDFVNGYKDEAAEFAKQVDVPMEFILGLAAEETRWGTGDVGNKDNNYFSMHAPAPFQTGSRVAKKNPKVQIAQFKTVHDSGRSFIKKYGDSIRGARDPKEFGQRLKDAGYNRERADFVDYLAGRIGETKRRLACP